MKKPKTVSAVTQKLSSQVYEHARKGKLVLTLGGDHSIAVGTVSGTAKAIRERLGREMAVIWVDAHADINTPEASDSGNIHGMPLAFLTGLAKEEREDVFGWIKDEHMISTRKLVYIGLRDVDREEKVTLREHGIKAFSMHDVDRYVMAFLSFLLILLLVNGSSNQSCLLVIVMVLEEWLRWLWRILDPILPSTCRLTWMDSIQCGPQVPVHL